MKLPKELTTVTPLSKYLAIVLFIALPIVGFFLGIRYQEMTDLANRQEMEANLAIPRTPTPTPDETANWKTYIDPKSEFSFKYPENYAFDESKNRAISFKSNGRLNLVLIVTPYDKGERKTLKEIYESLKSIAGAAHTQNYIDAQGRNWTLVNHGGIDVGYSISAEYEGSSKNYLIEIQARLSEEKQLIPFANQILATFKFTDQ